MTKLPDYTRGDTFDALTINCVFRDANGDPTTPPGTFVSARLLFQRAGANQTLLRELSTSNALLTQTTVGNTWRFVSVPTVLHAAYSGQAEFFLIVTYTEGGVSKTRTFATGSLSIRRGALV